jgi:DNA-directed RNA polymerase
MVLPPIPWDSETDGYDGGYITRRNPLVRGGCGQRYNPGPEGYPKEVLSAVNSIQQVPWRINKFVLDVLDTLREEGSTLGELPGMEDLPTSPWDTVEAFREAKAECPDDVKAWKKTRLETYKTNIKTSTKLISLNIQLKIAKMYHSYERIYFPHFLDWRGRVYPQVLFLNPQGDDRAKSLLEYGTAKPLDTIDAKTWFMVHGANCFGEDKCTFGERISWVQKNHANIIDSGTNPLDGNRLWSEADSPFQFLAWCYEYSEYVKDPQGFVSRLPIAMDGTCSGLQHFSALLRDEKGGRSVNLLPSASPKDIYAEVAKVCADKVQVDLKNMKNMPKTANREAVPIRHYARLWHGKVDRSVAKPNTMTVPYGVTKRGMSDQLLTLIAKGKVTIASDDLWGPCAWLAEHMYDSINEVVISAELGKKFLREVGTAVAKSGKDVTWESPLGFKVTQRYRKWKSKKVKTIYGGMTIYSMLNVAETKRVDTRRATNGTAPNFIHSLDAAHLMETVNRLPEDTSICVIHDSFATHASDVTALRSTLKESFVSIYKDKDLLKDFLECMPTKDEDGEEIVYPETPSQGGLEINDILGSEYIFS